MMKQINLIPSEMSVPVKFVNLGRNLSKFTTLGLIVLIILVLGLIAGFVYYDLEYKKSIANIEDLKSQVVELEKSEQRLVLAKDRLSKVASVLAIDAIDDELLALQNFESLLPGSPVSTFSEITMSPDKVDTSIVFSDSNSLGSLLSSLPFLSEYKQIVLSAFGFNSTTGYLVSLVFR